MTAYGCHNPQKTLEIKHSRSPVIGRGVAAASACFVLSLAPVLGLWNMVFMQFSFVSDHLSYLALPVVTAVAGALAARLFHRGRPWRQLTMAASAAALVLLGISTACRAHVFASDERLWNNTARRNVAAWVAHDHLAAQAAARGDTAEAIGQLRLAADYAPPARGVGYRCRLAYLLSQQRQLDQARQVLEGCDWPKADPVDKAKARQQLGGILRDLGQLEQARQVLQGAVAEADPNFPTLHATALNNLASLLAEDLHQPAAAVDYARLAVQIAPQNGDFADTLGWAYFLAGQPGLAEQALRRAVGTRPIALYRYHLGMVLEAQGRRAEANVQYKLGFEMIQANPADEWYDRLKARLQETSAP
jgi:tetratricopeptide (TPR) repeat protein